MVGEAKLDEDGNKRFKNDRAADVGIILSKTVQQKVMNRFTPICDQNPKYKNQSQDDFGFYVGEEVTCKYKGRLVKRIVTTVKLDSGQDDDTWTVIFEYIFLTVPMNTVSTANTVLRSSSLGTPYLSTVRLSSRTVQLYPTPYSVYS